MSPTGGLDLPVTVLHERSFRKHISVYEMVQYAEVQGKLAFALLPQVLGGLIDPNA